MSLITTNESIPMCGVKWDEWVLSALHHVVPACVETPLLTLNDFWKWETHFRRQVVFKSVSEWTTCYRCLRHTNTPAGSFLLALRCSYRCCRYKDRCRVNKSLQHYACLTDGISADLGVFAHVWPPLPRLDVECLLWLYSSPPSSVTRDEDGAEVQSESWDFKCWCGR